MLTDEGVPAGEIEWRVAYVLAQVRSERDPWSEPTPTTAASGRLEEPTHGQATR